MFFSSADSGRHVDRYSYVMHSVALAEELGFEAAWLPERHFHPFGGLFPSPAVLGAALATRTKRIGIRAGSVVVPLHDVARIAEDWAMVDALSGGRAGLSLATGWNRGDFAIARCEFERRREYTFSSVETLRALWRGDQAKTASGEPVRTFPAPVQRELPLWLTATSGPKTFAEAGRRGCHLLTAYLQLDRPALESNVRLYRETLAEHSPGTAPHVTLMVHACVAETAAHAFTAAEKPLVAYQRQFLDLNDRAGGPGQPLTEREKQELARFTARKYAAERGLVGSPAEVAARLTELGAIGVHEVACLVDFGVSAEQMAETMRQLARVTG